MKIALAQINPTIGDIAGNSAKVIDVIERATGCGAELVVFPELTIIGYPPKDLLLKRGFIDDNIAALNDIARHCTACAALVGYADRHEAAQGLALHNAAALLAGGKVAARYYKQLLPTYDVFDESRYFEPAASQQVVEFNGQRLGLTICEDVWNEPTGRGRSLYHARPFGDLAQAGVDLILNMSASPFVVDKHAFRCELFGQQCRQHGLAMVYVNQVGGNDDLVFDGCSCAFDSRGKLIAQAKSFDEDLLLLDFEQPSETRIEAVSTGVASIHDALVLGLRDYVRKCGFETVVLGLSGGIDSAVTAALATTALGADKVTGVALPSRYSSDHSVADAERLAKNLGIRLLTIPIELVHRAMEETLADCFAGREADVTEENIQARARGNILMALSNKFGHLLLATGNKSEVAVGYCTLYGDMAGGLAVISDVPKTMVYELARYINHSGEVIPAATITKPPSAELRPDQIDQDSLPPYDVLDQIVQRYVEQDQSVGEIVGAGIDEETVTRVIGLIDRNEYKRRQAAPGLKVTGRAFGFGRRMPIAQRYQG